MITSKSIKTDNIDELLSLLREKDEEIKLLVRMCKEKEQLTENLFGGGSDLTTLQQITSSLQKSILQLELEQLQIKKEWKGISEALNRKMQQLESDHEKAQLEFGAINEARLEVIQKQKNAIESYQRLNLRLRIRLFLGAKIGVLYQHEPKRLSIPKRYNKKITLKNAPTISIVTPSFNQADYIERTILSVINQEYPKLEYVVQDGGSSDHTVSVITRHADSIKHWESKKDNGQSNAINLGFKHTTGDIMAYLNSDDMILPGTLHYVADYFSKNPDVDVVYGHRILIDEYDQDVGRWILPRHNNQVLTWADYIPQETLFWRRSIWDKAGGQIDENFRFAMDWDLLLRFKELNAKFVRLPRFLGAFRIHPHQKTSSEMTTLGMQEMEKLRIRCHGRRVSHFEIKDNLRAYKIEHVILHKLYRMGILRY